MMRLVQGQRTNVVEDDLVNVRLRTRSGEGGDEERPEQASPRSTQAERDEDSENET